MGSKPATTHSIGKHERCFECLFMEGCFVLYCNVFNDIQLLLIKFKFSFKLRVKTDTNGFV